jgi:ATP-dependent Lon protease
MDELLGQGRFRADERRKQRLPGVVQGLAWTPFGGDVLYVEAVASPGKGALQLTGSLGDVMSESARLALSYLKSHAGNYGLDLDALAATDLHLHFPAGAIKKDGPSAGIAIACAFVGCLTGRKAPVDLAMTGELTLVGEVLPIGGVREKVLAAKNFGLSRVILPKGNKPDVDELKKDLVRGIEVHYVERFAEVFAIVFGDQPAVAGRAGKRVRRKPKKAAQARPVKKAAKRPAKTSRKPPAKRARKPRR